MPPLTNTELVCKSILSGVTGCFEWGPKTARRIRAEMAALGTTISPDWIKSQVVELVKLGQPIKEVEEKRPEYSDYQHYHTVILPTPGVFKKGLFVEMVLDDPDTDLPVVYIVNAHEQKS